MKRLLSVLAFVAFTVPFAPQAVTIVTATEAAAWPKKMCLATVYLAPAQAKAYSTAPAQTANLATPKIALALEAEMVACSVG